MGIFLCILSLLLKDNNLFETEGSEAWASALLIVLNVAIVGIAVAAQVHHNRTSTRISQSGRFSKSTNPYDTYGTITLPKMSVASISKPRGSLFRASEASVRDAAGNKVMPAASSEG